MQDNFNKMKSVADELTILLPATSWLRKKVNFELSEFELNIFTSCIKSFKTELKNTFSQMEF